MLSFCPLKAKGQSIIALRNQKEALVYERDLIKSAPGNFYLIIDLSSQQVYLKADGHLLRSCPIQGQSHFTIRRTQTHQFIKRIDPITKEPGNTGLRQRGRILPLNFHQRLVEGPRHHSRLYFYPNLLIQATGLPTPTTPHVILSPSDVKSLGSALRQNHTSIFIPHTPSHEARP